MKNNKELRNWLDEFNLNHPLTIAGPWSAETEDQVLKIAHSLKDTKATVKGWFKLNSSSQFLNSLLFFILFL